MSLEKFREKFRDVIVSEGEFRGQVFFNIKKESILEVSRYLQADPEQYYDYLSDICSVDYIGEEQRFEVVYNMYSTKHNKRIRIKARVSESDLEIESVENVWKSANWFEREVYDMMGIKFKNHPNMTRLLMPDDWEGHPLRKDYPLEGLPGQRDYIIKDK